MSLTFACYPSYEGRVNDKWLEEHRPGAYMGMGETAENVAKKYGITRHEMEVMAVESHAKAYKAQCEGKLSPSIIPVTVTDYYGKPVLDADGNEIIVDKDEGVRAGTSLESLGKLKPCFIENGSVTAGTSSQTNDCAAFAVLMSSKKAQELGIKPLCRIKGYAVAGCDATLMGLGPIYAVPKALARAGITLDEIDTVEINEAFAAQSLACIRELGIDMEKVNPYGGAMALGHPLGCTGTILLGKVIDYLNDTNGKYGLITMCIGGGMGAAAVVEKL